MELKPLTDSEINRLLASALIRATLIKSDYTTITKEWLEAGERLADLERRRVSIMQDSYNNQNDISRWRSIRQP